MSACVLGRGRPTCKRLGGCRSLSQNICTFILLWRRAKILKYRQNIKITMRIKISKKRLYRRRFLREKRHFAAFFKIYTKMQLKSPAHFRFCEGFFDGLGRRRFFRWPSSFLSSSLSIASVGKKSFAPNFQNTKIFAHILRFWPSTLARDG